MSGGTFDHRNYMLHDWAEDIDTWISSNESMEAGEWGGTVGRHYPQEILDKYAETRDALLKAEAMLHCVDYLEAGDLGENSFLERWKERVK